MSKDVKFARLVGVQRDAVGSRMELPLTENVQNHVGSMHASAQFALAEIGSGDFIRKTFPDLEGQVMAVVRRAEIKYSKPVEGLLTAHPYIEEGEQEKFEQNLATKGRAILPVHVKLQAENGDIATHAVYQWFVTKL